MRSHTAAAVAILGGCALGLPSLRQPAGMLAAAGSSIGLLAVARSAGLTADDLGLGAQTAPRGVTVAGGAAAAAVTSYGLLLRTRWAAAVFDDDRLPADWRPALVEAFAVIPLQTVWLEEIGYRGVLPALIERDHGPRAAAVASAALFGLSHVRPAVEFEHARRREESGSTAGRGRGNRGGHHGGRAGAGLAAPPYRQPAGPHGSALVAERRWGPRRGQRAPRSSSDCR